MTRGEKNSVATGAGVSSRLAEVETHAGSRRRAETFLLPEHDDVSGTPSAGSRIVRILDHVEVGFWGMTPRGARDVEADEVFVVLSGAASVRFDHGREISLEPGDVMSVFKGELTTGTVTDTLRKVYIRRSDDAART